MQDVQYYSSMEKELKHSQVHKAHKLLELGCIEYDKERRLFVCKPIPGYNSTTYELVSLSSAEQVKLGDSSVSHSCSCQGYVTKQKRGETPFCSHLLALHYYFDARNRQNGWGRYREASL